MPHPDAYRIAESVLRALAPEELPDLPEVWRDHTPSWTRRVRRRATGWALGSGLSGALTEWAPFVVAFVTSEDLSDPALPDRAAAAALAADRTPPDPDRFAAALADALRPGP
ncbi:hypothetical protein ACFQV2_05175 [Actinokineospora soli]|uniref:Uncharacterized protein n=1 Tax=Actinokineospora soli TaxID=1048753 RepID=A0ABW2THG9_9PSEU